MTSVCRKGLSTSQSSSTQLGFPPSAMLLAVAKTGKRHSSGCRQGAAWVQREYDLDPSLQAKQHCSVNCSCCQANSPDQAATTVSNNSERCATSVLQIVVV